MVTGEASAGATAAKRGLWRLMLKLPAVRGRLQLLAAQPSPLDGLLEAYEEASTALERMSRDRPRQECPLIEEYEAMCAEIESDVVRYVLEHSQNALE